MIIVALIPVLASFVGGHLLTLDYTVPRLKEQRKATFKGNTTAWDFTFEDEIKWYFLGPTFLVWLVVIGIHIHRNSSLSFGELAAVTILFSAMIGGLATIAALNIGLLFAKGLCFLWYRILRCGP